MICKSVLYKGMSHVFAQENYGVVADASQMCFHVDLLQKYILDGQIFHMEHEPEGVFIGIDPSGGGSSELSVTAMAIMPYKHLVVRNTFIDNVSIFLRRIVHIYFVGIHALDGIVHVINPFTILPQIRREIFQMVS